MSPSPHRTLINSTFRVEDSEFSDGDSNHLLYLDRTARADILRNTLYRPGAGHALRVVAANYHIEDNVVSNVSLDGTPSVKFDNPDPGGRLIVGLHPLEAFVCGDGIIKGNTVTKHVTNATGGALVLRARNAISRCELLGKSEDGKSWVEMWPKDDPLAHLSSTWTDIRADFASHGASSRFIFDSRIENNTILLTGDTRDQGNLGAGMRLHSTFPSHRSSERTAIRQALAAHLEEYNSGGFGTAMSCAQLSAQVTDAAPPFDPDRDVSGDALRWLFDRVTPLWSWAVCALDGQGGYTPGGSPRNQFDMPLDTPDEWMERQTVTLSNNSVLSCETVGTCVSRPPCSQGGPPDVIRDSWESKFTHPGETGSNPNNDDFGARVLDSDGMCVVQADP